MASKTAQALIDGLKCKYELKVRLSMYRHALLQIEAREERIAELEAAINRHNTECAEMCDLRRNDEHVGCDPRYGPDKRRTCPDCPRDWIIEDALQEGEG